MSIYDYGYSLREHLQGNVYSCSVIRNKSEIIHTEQRAVGEGEELDDEEELDIRQSLEKDCKAWIGRNRFYVDDIKALDPSKFYYAGLTDSCARKELIDNWFLYADSESPDHLWLNAQECWDSFILSEDFYFIYEPGMIVKCEIGHGLTDDHYLGVIEKIKNPSGMDFTKDFPSDYYIGEGLLFVKPLCKHSKGFQTLSNIPHYVYKETSIDGEEVEELIGEHHLIFGMDHYLEPANKEEIEDFFKTSYEQLTLQEVEKVEDSTLQDKSEENNTTVDDWDYQPVREIETEKPEIQSTSDILESIGASDLIKDIPQEASQVYLAVPNENCILVGQGGNIAFCSNRNQFEESKKGGKYYSLDSWEIKAAKTRYAIAKNTNGYAVLKIFNGYPEELTIRKTFDGCYKHIQKVIGDIQEESEAKVVKETDRSLRLEELSSQQDIQSEELKELLRIGDSFCHQQWLTEEGERITLERKFIKSFKVTVEGKNSFNFKSFKNAYNKVMALVDRRVVSREELEEENRKISEYKEKIDQDSNLVIDGWVFTSEKSHNRLVTICIEKRNPMNIETYSVVVKEDDQQVERYEFKHFKPAYNKANKIKTQYGQITEQRTDQIATEDIKEKEEMTQQQVAWVSIDVDGLREILGDQGLIERVYRTVRKNDPELADKLFQEEVIDVPHIVIPVVTTEPEVEETTESVEETTESVEETTELGEDTTELVEDTTELGEENGSEVVIHKFKKQGLLDTLQKPDSLRRLYDALAQDDPEMTSKLFITGEGKQPVSVMNILTNTLLFVTTSQMGMV